MSGNGKAGLDDGGGGTRKQILVIDDSRDIRELYRRLLESEGYEVASASNGSEGLDAVRASRPDLLIVDVVMPVVDGVDFLCRLRSDFAPPIPPAILCSGFDLTEEEALAHGAYAFVRKPISAPDFLQVVSNALAKQVPDQAAMLRGRQHATVAREHAAGDANAALGTTTIEELGERLRTALAWLRGYFDVDEAFVAIIRNGRLLLISDHEIHPVTDAPALPSPIAEIITTGETLILADAAKRPAFAPGLGLASVRSFVGVPVASPSGATTGAICLGRARVDPFPAEDVLVLEGVSRASSELFGRVEAHQADPYRGITLIGPTRALGREAFDTIVDMELRLALRRQEAIELALVDLGADFDGRGAEAIRSATDPRRLAVGVFGARRIALLKRGTDASGQIDAAVAALRRATRVAGIGSVVVVPSASGVVDSQTLIQLADRGLARCSSTGGHERMQLAPDGGVPRMG